MARLNKIIKEKILKTILEEKIQPLRNKLELEARKLAQKALKNEWEKYPEKVKSWIKASPDNTLQTISRVTVNVRDKENRTAGHLEHDGKNSVNANGYYKQSKYSLPISVKVLPSDYYNFDTLYVPYDSLFGLSVIELQNKALDLDKKEKAIATTINSAMNGCNTEAQFEKHYPELKKYIPLADPSDKPLMLSNDKVMECLDL